MNRPPLQRLNWQGTHPITGKQELLLHQASSSDGQLLCFSPLDRIQSDSNTTPPHTTVQKSTSVVFVAPEEQHLYYTHRAEWGLCLLPAAPRTEHCSRRFPPFVKHSLSGSLRWKAKAASFLSSAGETAAYHTINTMIWDLFTVWARDEQNNL